MLNKYGSANFQSPPAKQMSDQEDVGELERYMAILGLENGSMPEHVTLPREIRTSPLFTWPVKKFLQESSDSQDLHESDIQQFGVLGYDIDLSHGKPRPLFLNVDAPWSAFICGSQGSGKSYSLSCMVENCLLADESIGKLVNPPTGLLFHYDSHSADICEAATLASHIPVTVLVSPSNYWSRFRLYQAIDTKIQVRPLLFKDQHLNVQRIQRLMAFTDASGSVPLYMEVMVKILRAMAIQRREGAGLDFAEFLTRLERETELGVGQRGPMNLRLGLLSSFMANNYSFRRDFELSSRVQDADLFAVKPGHLTIVDLSDPLIDAAAACSLFDMCLGLGLEREAPGGRLVVLDEAHKFLTGTEAGDIFTSSLLQLIREQRHKGARIIVSTQEPTVSESLLDLCSVTMVHRFTSPAWLAALRQHLAGAHGKDKDLMEDIVSLGVGQSLLFSPSSVVGLDQGRPTRVGQDYIRFRTRRRITRDGGSSVMSQPADMALSSSAGGGSARVR